MITYNVPAEAKQITIGRQGENEARCFVFDITDWIQIFGDEGAAQLLMQRPGETAPYACLVSREEALVSWIVREADTQKKGYGQVELVYTIDDQVVKSRVLKARIEKALMPGYRDDLDPWEPWMEDVLKAAAKIDDFPGTVAEEVAGWLEENIGPTTPAIDKTLSVEGAGADAKKTGEEIADLKSALYNIDSLLESNTFDWSELSSSSHPTGFRSGYYNETTGVYTASGRWLCTAARTLKFESYDGIIVTPPPGYSVFVTEYIDTTFVNKHGDPNAINESVVVPLVSGHNYGITVGRWPNEDAGSYNNAEFLSGIRCSLIATDKRVFKFRGRASDLGYTQITDFDKNGWYQLPGAYVASVSGLPEEYPAQTGGFLEVFEFNDSKSAVSYKKWLVLHASNGMTWLNFVFADETLAGWQIMSGYSERFAGKTLSLLGASGSSFVGYVPEGNDAYYTGSNNGVTSVDQMWWKIVCDHFGMTPLVIDAWSGSAVCYNAATDAAHSDTRKIPMCSDLRTGRLAQNGVSPDVIIVVGGTNDWTYSKSTTTPIGDWTGRTAVDETAVTSGESTFMESYASMIHKLQVNYPEAIVVCFSCIFTGRGNDLGITKVNDVGLTENDYNDAIKKVCDIMGVPFLDVYDVGFSYQNYYPTYAPDSSTHPTHPNAAGHAVIAKRVIDRLPDLIAQFV